MGRKIVRLYLPEKAAQWSEKLTITGNVRMTVWLRLDSAASNLQLINSNINSNDTETDISNDLPANLTVPKQVGTTLRR